MGMFLNPSSVGFEKNLRSEIYVDKSLLIGELNRCVRTEDCYVCTSRPRRFGKSMMLRMLAAYYQSETNTHELFKGLKIASHPSFEEHINKYEVVVVDMQSALSKTRNVQALIDYLTENILSELRKSYGISEQRYLSDGFEKAFYATGKEFVFLIDEWDCVLRELKGQKEQQDLYLDFIRELLKNKTYVALAYMTGILPIKNYGTYSTLNIFKERSITAPGIFAEYFGFTAEETRALCTQYNMNFEEIRHWYDGYELWSAKTGIVHIYNPNSVVNALQEGEIRNYWNRTEQMEALQSFIDKDYKGLRSDVVRLIAGEHIAVQTGGFKNDMETFGVKDDILTLLIHLGYLTYNTEESRAYIPNREVAEEFYYCVRDSEKYQTVFAAIDASRELLSNVWKGDELAVAEGIKRAHAEMPIIQRNNENSLACVVALALYSARDYYTIVRELPAGEGFADLAYIPMPEAADKPAMIVELKWDKSATTAIDQIRSKNYVGALGAYYANLLLVGVNYDKDKHEYECKIEKF